MTACGGGGGTVSTTPYVLTVSSTNPASAVAITVSPADINSKASGTTSFSLTYDAGTSVTLTAPATSGGNNFSSWSGGCTSTTVTCNVTMSGNTTVTANYTAVAVTTYTLTVDSTNPASGVAITNSPADNNSLTGGNTSYTLTYNSGASVTLTAPATKSGNNFSSWSGGCTSTTVTCNVTLNANTTVTANYTTPVTTYTLTVNSTNPASGVAITNSPADNNSLTGGNTSYTLTYNSGASVTLTAPAAKSGNNFSSWSGGCTSTTVTCNVTLSANTTVTANYTAASSTTYTLTVDSTNPASGVAIIVSPADINGSSSGATHFTRTYNSGAAVTLTAPSASGIDPFASWSGCTTASTVTCDVTISANTTVTANYTVLIAPTVAVSWPSGPITTVDPVDVTVAVSSTGNPTPTGSVQLAFGSYTSSAATLNGGSAQITIPANTLTAGSDTLTATYTPDANSSTVYKSATGNSSPGTVASTVTVDPSSDLGKATDQLLGMNMAVWDSTPLADAVTPFEAAGIKAVRWPGGSTSDYYHWEGASTDPNNPSLPSMCPKGSYAFTNVTFKDFVNDLAIPAGLDIALTADYGSDPSCTVGGLPSEAAAWVANALTLGVTVSHMTVGNENYGHWEEDLHTKQWDPATYAAAVVGSSGFYQSIKTASSKTAVGVVVDADNTTGKWDNIVLANAKGSYDF
ncbi:MAG: hypothetical protein ABR991_12000, partial [Terracidiphilus sp.]